MSRVNTVLGAVDTADLGFTLMHEHIMSVNWPMRQAYSDWVDRETVINEAVSSLLSAKEKGVESIVDVTPINLGRDINIIREVSERAEIHIVAATGFYWFEEGWLEGWETDRIVGTLIKDIQKGIQGTDSKAGIIKAATGEIGVTKYNEKILRIAARLHNASGIPITTHTSATHRVGQGQLEVFKQEGVNLHKVVVGHCGDTDDIEYLESLLSQGCYIGMDRFGLDMLLSKEKRINTVSELCRRGWAGQIVLSQDYNSFIDWFPKEGIIKHVPDWSYSYISEQIIPALRETGVSQTQIDSIIIENPATILGQ